MEANYFSIYRVSGVAGLPGNSDIELLTENNSRSRVYFAVEPRLFDVWNRHAALSLLLGSAFPGTAALPGTTPLERYEVALARVIQSRNRERPTLGKILAVQIIDEVPSPNLAHMMMDLGEFAYALQVFDEALFAKRARKAFSRAFAGLSLALPDGTSNNVQPLGSFSFLVDEQSKKTIYNGAINGFGSSIHMNHIGSDVIGDAVKFAATLTATDELHTVARLLTQSLDDTNDTVRSFLGAWTGLEVFINKVFPGYETRLLGLLEGNAPHAVGPFIERLKSVMKDKYKLVDKFVVVTSFLDGDSAEADTQRFKTIKKTRDEFAHAMRVDPSQLPADEARTLLQKYLRLHLLNGEP